MIYNFRIDRNNRDEILRRIKEISLLSQGWGGGEEGGLSLIENEDNFQYLVQKRYELNTTRIPTNLTKIRGFKDNDIIVVPHLPEDRKFSIFVVDGDYEDCYIYNETDDLNLNHTIKIKEAYGIDGNLSMYHSLVASWKGKLQWMRLPILPINQYKTEFHQLLSELRDNSNLEFGKSSLQEHLEIIHTETLKFLSRKLQNISPSGGEINFEAVCEYVLMHNGYEITKRNEYDGEGGDVDLVCVKEKADISPFEQGEETLYVQIKKHKGTSNKKGVEQLLNMLNKNSRANGCLISLAENFSDDAVTIANENGIVLINGLDLSDLLIAVMTDRI